MTDVSTTQSNALTGAKSLKNNNEIRHSIADTNSLTEEITTTSTISLTNGSTIKINNKQYKPTTIITKNEEYITETATTTQTPTTTAAMSTVGVKSPTSTTQSPATTPSQTLVSYDTSTSACSTTLISSSSSSLANQTNQIITKPPALQSDKVSITPETITLPTTTSSPTLNTCDSSINMVGNATTLNSSNSCSSPSLKVMGKQTREASAQDVEEVARLFEEKPEAFEKWLMERAPPEALARLHEFIESRKQPLKRPSVTSDLFQQWMSSSPIQRNRSLSSVSSVSHLVLDNRRHLMELDEGDLFMELIRDVANELDIDVLCHKILVNVGLLTHADRGSLFLAKGPPNNRYLVAKLFDVTQKTHIFS